ncbi:MAG: acyltransferase [Cyanobacteria bacterium J06621_12]
MKTAATITKQNNSRRQRVEWVDYAKGMGIFLMVFGHTLRGLVNSSLIPDTSPVQFIDAWIYAFHIPLFFFLSGLFFPSVSSQAPTTWWQKKLKTLVYPYFLWSGMQILLKSGFSGAVNHDANTSVLTEIVYDPVDQFWFIYTLFLVSLAFYFGSRLGLTLQQLLWVAIALYLAHVLRINFGGWGMLYLFRRHAIYFAVGAIIGSGKISGWLSNIKQSLLILLGIFLLLIVGALTKIQAGENIAAVPPIALIGTAAIVCFAFALEKFQFGLWLKNWGSLTLQIYLAHTIASAVFRTVLQKIGINDPIIHLILGTMVGIYVPIWLHRCCQQVGFKYLFTLPSKARVVRDN